MTDQDEGEYLLTEQKTIKKLRNFMSELYETSVSKTAKSFSSFSHFLLQAKPKQDTLSNLAQKQSFKELKDFFVQMKDNFTQNLDTLQNRVSLALKKSQTDEIQNEIQNTDKIDNFYGLTQHDSSKLNLNVSILYKKMKNQVKKDINQLSNLEKNKQLLEQQLNKVNEELEQLKETKQSLIIENKKRVDFLHVELSPEKFEENKKLLKKIKLEQNERLKKKEELRKNREEQYDLEMKQSSLTIQERNRQIQEQKRLEIEKRLKELHEKQKMRQITVQEQVVKIKEKPLFQKLEQQYELMNQQEQERISKELEKKKKLYVPVDMNEIKAHAQKYEEEIKHREFERKKQILNNQVFYDEQQQQYGSLFYKKVLDDEKKQKELEAKAEFDKVFRIEKQKKYSEIVKDMYFPPIEPKKARTAIEKQTVNNNKKSSRYDNVNESQKFFVQKIKKNEQIVSKSHQNNPITEEKKRPVIVSKSPQAVRQSSPSPVLIVPPNYLQEIKEERKKMENEGKIFVTKIKLWRNILKTHEKNDKEFGDKRDNESIQGVIENVKGMENQAKMKEQLLKYGGVNKQNEDQIRREITEMYVESIKAKIALLS